MYDMTLATLAACTEREEECRRGGGLPQGKGTLAGDEP